MLRSASAVRRAVARPGEIGATEPFDSHSTLGPTRHDRRLGRRSVARRRRRARRRRACAARARARAPDPARRRGATASTGDIIATRITRRISSRLPHSRSLGQFGCSRCHCSGAARISASNSCASVLGDPGDVVAQPARRASTVERRPHHPVVAAAAARSTPRRAPASRRCAARASPGRPGSVVRSPKNSTSTPSPVEVAVAEQAHDAVVAQRAQHRRARRRDRAARPRCRSPRAARANHVEQLRRLDRLDDGEHVVALRRPSTRRPLPAAEMRQREDHAVARGEPGGRCARSPRS